ncbi:hypothetical protein ABVK25_004849 [Lepraria finkii]|uniref:Uncharacterized protein n=1 Tax=Lepraria finkii TaxID=1340010 RepID=A0ABR4BAY1_9LECA
MLPKIIIPALMLLTSTAVHADSFYLYTCNGCNCNAFQSVGSGDEGKCKKLDSGAASVGLSSTSSSKLQCTLYTSSDCSGAGSSQNVGIKSGQSWGCTNSQIGWVNSMDCGYQIF